MKDYRVKTITQIINVFFLIDSWKTVIGNYSSQLFFFFFFCVSAVVTECQPLIGYHRERAVPRTTFDAGV